MYAPTTLASAREFWMLRYTTSLEDGSLVVSMIMISIFLSHALPKTFELFIHGTFFFIHLFLQGKCYIITFFT